MSWILVAMALSVGDPNIAPVRPHGYQEKKFAPGNKRSAQMLSRRFMRLARSVLISPIF
jgi:hypothetical protein